MNITFCAVTFGTYAVVMRAYLYSRKQKKTEIESTQDKQQPDLVKLLEAAKANQLH